MTKQCWICGGTADSREHIVKSTDIKLVLGAEPDRIFLNDEKHRNRRVQSRRSNYFKYKTSLCFKCNSTLSQPYDRAWERLSEHLFGLPRLSAGTLVDLSKPFKGRVKTEATNIHLFFVKLFGCFLAQEDPVFDLSSFAEALRTRSSHPNIFLEFGVLPKSNEPANASRSHLIAVQTDNVVHYMFWAYHLHRFTVGISYLLEPTRHPASMKWHPTTSGKLIKITGLRPNNSFKPTPLRSSSRVPTLR